MHHPPWIALCVIYATVFSRVSSGTNTTGGRYQREISDRDRRLIPYMTFYVAQSYQNPQSGERENVLIPVQGMQQDNVDQYNGVPQVQSNNIQNSQQYQLVPRAVIMRLQEAGFLPISQVQVPQPNIEPNPQVSAQIYGFRSPGPQPQQLQQLHQLQQQQQQEQQQQPQPPRSYQPILKSEPESKYEKYLAPQLVKVVPNYVQRERPTKYVPQHTYTSTKLQAYIPNSYNPNYYKPQQETYTPNKVYTLNISPPNNQKFIYQRVRPRQREEKPKYPSTKLYLTTTASPYTNKVKFELEDARIPNSVQLEQIKAITLTKLHSTPDTYTRPENSNSGLSDYLEIEKNPTENYYKPERQPIEYVPEVNTAIPVSNDISQPTPQTLEYNEYVDEKLISKPNAENVFTILKQSNQLSQNFTPDNIDGNVKTLALILERLRQPEKKPHRFQVPSSVNKEKPPKVQVQVQEQEQKPKSHNYPASSGTSTPGKPGIDYPIYSTIPHTRFDCSTQRYKGFFGDPDTHCQVWHYCDLNGGQASFLCPNGTIFNQVALTCDWWFNVRCASTSQLYVLNERLYKYILPFSPSFPEDYSGPLVDRYLSAKFKEMEAKSRIKALKALITTPKPEEAASPTISISTEESQTYEPETE